MIHKISERVFSYVKSTENTPKNLQNFSLKSLKIFQSLLYIDVIRFNTTMEYKTKTSVVASQVETSTGNLKHLVNLAKEAGLITPGEAKCYLRDITVLHFNTTF